MNQILQNFARSWLTEHLAQCTDGQRDVFVRMYGPQICPPNASIEKVVQVMRIDQLDWAMEQVQRTLEKSARAAVTEEGGR